MESVSLGRLLVRLLRCAEVSAEIARDFRAEESSVFDSLVEEKSSRERNERFARDFKTLADVLVQVTIKAKLEEEFPTISSRIQGEEQNSFQNISGECIKVELSDCQQETARLLSRVLDGNDGFAGRIAAVVHAVGEDPVVEERVDAHFPADRIGIWIDPIDSTLEYIQGKCADSESSAHGIAQFGLSSVSVLIGAYDLETGDPLLGVVTQPFYAKDYEGRWSSKHYWGLARPPLTSLRATPHPTNHRSRKIVVTSRSEDTNLQRFLDRKYHVVHVSGAGYKSLLVARGDADLYALSRGSTYLWDTCAPQALLVAQGGGMLDFRMARRCEGDALKDCQVRYRPDNGMAKPFQNSGGVLAYRNPADALEFLDYLRSQDFHEK